MAVAGTSPGHRTAGVALALLWRQAGRAALIATDQADGATIDAPVMWGSALRPSSARGGVRDQKSA